MASVEAPTGTVTFLFTDVEGSSQLWDEQQSAMSLALERHDAVLRTAITNANGYVFATGGDGFAAAFARAHDAINAAVDAQRTLTNENWVGAEIRVRMGLHTGEAQERDGNYFGPAVNRAARVMDTGHGGQILLSATTTDLLVDTDIETRVVGELRLKGLTRPETISQLCGQGLTDAFPELRARHATIGNLSKPRQTIVGRADTIAEIAALTQQQRLTTLTGVGGVGKTRLALAVAEAIENRFADGVWFIELAEVLDGTGVVPAITSTLGIQLHTAQTPVESLIEALAQQEMLLVLDNCEHVVEEAEHVVDEILAKTDRTVVLATSREALAIPGERLVAVPPLSTSDGARSAAVDLFIDRATSGGWAKPGDLEPLVELCRRLDGVPLAIELAAARARSMSIDEILERLDDRFRLLKGNRRSVDRHQTLRTTVDWSYGLLEPDEQRIFNRLSVFAGDFDLDAAETVCTDEELDRYDLADLIGSFAFEGGVSSGV